MKPFGDVQRKSIAQDEEVIRNGGKVCKAEPRGFGKTTRTGNAALFATLYNLRRMVPVFSANMEKSKTQIMGRWKAELLGNDLLYWMFPKIIWPFRSLGNKPQGAASQTYKGKLTHLKWTSDRIVFPTIEGEPASGNILIALPLASCRGATHTLPNGTILRPELLIFDDVQKDEDADNPNTVGKLIDLIDHSAMMLGSHSQTLSAIMNCTVRRADDLSEHYLGKPGWRHVRYKMLEKPAELEKEFWLGEYAELRRKYDPENPEDQRRAQKECLQLYLRKRDAADRGAVVTWDWAYAWNDNDPVEVSAIQHAYNILIDLGEEVFASECQNEPIRETGGLVLLPPDKIRLKQSGYMQNVTPAEVTTLITHVDVHPSILYWHVWAFEPGFTSYLIDDNTFPRQRRRNFRHNVLQLPLQNVFPGYDFNATLFAALDLLIHGGSISVNGQTYTEHGLMRREFIKSDGVPLRITACGIDASGQASDVAKKFVRQSPFAASLVPLFGRGITAKQLPMAMWTQAKGKKDDHWVLTKGKPGEPPSLVYDTNYWKTNFHRALALPYEAKGNASLHKVENPEYWRRFSEACHSERPREVTSEGRTVYEFGEPRPGTFNHDFDVAVACRVLASRSGISSIKAEPAKKRISLARLQRERQSRG